MMMIVLDKQGLIRCRKMKLLKAKKKKIMKNMNGKFVCETKERI